METNTYFIFIAKVPELVHECGTATKFCFCVLIIFKVEVLIHITSIEVKKITQNFFLPSKSITIGLCLPLQVFITRTAFTVGKTVLVVVVVLVTVVVVVVLDVVVVVVSTEPFRQKSKSTAYNAIPLTYSLLVKNGSMILLLPLLSCQTSVSSKLSALNSHKILR